MNKQNKAKIEEWETEIKELEGKIEEIKQKNLSILTEKNKKVLGRCFQKKNIYLKIISSWEGDLYCNQVDFDCCDLSVDYNIAFSSVKEIEEDGYVEISLEVFDKQFKSETLASMENFFKVEEKQVVE